ncbi:MAG TPA: DUF4340 domain-containing protein [Spirochaetota bacterium]|nr:DUF4340 domain-containing protein [Spirochaetota bacterium]
MNRKILASLALIAVLAVVLLVLTREKGADLPRQESWSGETEEIVLRKSGETIRLFRSDGTWLIGEAAYPADAQVVAGLEERMKNLVLTDLISSREHYERYDLGDDRAIEVSLRSGGKLVRHVFIGKKSSTFRHTYVRLSGHPGVYLATGALSDEFGKSLDELRNRDIFSETKSAINSIEIRYGASSITLARRAAPEAARADKKADAPEEDHWECVSCATPVDANRVGQIAGSFAPFTAAAFPAIDKKTLGAPRCTVRIKTADKLIELAFYSKIGDNRYLCTSTESPYVFAVDGWKAERYFVTAKDLKERK